MKATTYCCGFFIFKTIDMTDTQIIKQLLNGYHLSPKELEYADKLTQRLRNDVLKRLGQ